MPTFADGGSCNAHAFGASSVALQGLEQSHQPTADRALIEEAVRAGQQDEVQPYPLQQSLDGLTTVGAVYTPFVRIARYVWNARQQRREVGIDDVPDDVKSPVLHVVLQRPATDHPLEGILMAAIQRPATWPPPGKSAYFMPVGNRMPRPITMITVQSLEAMVGKVSAIRSSLVGVFPGDFAHQSVLEFCFYHPSEGGSYHVVSGYVTGPVR